LDSVVVVLLHFLHLRFQSRNIITIGAIIVTTVVLGPARRYS